MFYITIQKKNALYLSNLDSINTILLFTLAYTKECIWLWLHTLIHCNKFDSLKTFFFFFFNEKSHKQLTD